MIRVFVYLSLLALTSSSSHYQLRDAGIRMTSSSMQFFIGNAPLRHIAGSQRCASASFRNRNVLGPSLLQPPNTRSNRKCRMIMPNEGFEEPESVAERLYRRSLQRAEGKKVDSTEPKDTSKPDIADDGDRKTTFELELARPLGLVLKEIAGHGVYVEALTNGSALSAGVRRGDRIVATGSTIGNTMWEKNSLDGILSAVNSGSCSCAAAVPSQPRTSIQRRRRRRR